MVRRKLIITTAMFTHNTSERTNEEISKLVLTTDQICSTHGAVSVFVFLSSSAEVKEDETFYLTFFLDRRVKEVK